MNKAIKRIVEKYGEGSIIPASEVSPVHRWSTGSLGLDFMTAGGFAFDRIIEIYGPRSSGKTSVALMAARSYLEAVSDGAVLFVDSESEFDRSYAAKFIGPKLSKGRFFYYRSSIIENIQPVVFDAVSSDDPILLVIDSIANLRSVSEYEKDEEDPGGSRRRASHAAAVSPFVYGIINKLAQADPRNPRFTSVIFLNQIRLNPTAMFSDPETTPGGKAKDHAVTQQIALHRSSALRADPDKKTSRKVGFSVRAALTKTRVFGRDGASAVLHYYQEAWRGLPAHSFDDAQDLLPFLTEYGLVQRAGASYKIKGQSVRGKDAVLEYLRERPALLRSLCFDLIQKCWGSSGDVIVGSPSRKRKLKFSR